MKDLESIIKIVELLSNKVCQVLDTIVDYDEDEEHSNTEAYYSGQRDAFNECLNVLKKLGDDK